MTSTAADGVAYRARHPGRAASSAAAYRDRHPDRAQESQDQHRSRAQERYEQSYTLENWPHVILKTLRQRAKKKELPFDLDIADIVVPQFCPVLGIQLHVNRGGVGNNSPSVDRIKNSQGYVKGNIRVISHRANRLKCDATVDELKLVLADLERTNG